MKRYDIGEASNGRTERIRFAAIRSALTNDSEWIKALSIAETILAAIVLNVGSSNVGHFANANEFTRLVVDLLGQRGAIP